MTLKQKCTFLINSCDAYSDVWEFFFKALRVQWPDCEFPLALSTETKKFSDPGVRVLNFDSPCWAARFKNALKNIETPYVLHGLEDFVLKEKISGGEIISNVIKWLDENPDIGVFYLHKHSSVLQTPTEIPGFGLLPRKADYKLSTQFGIWRKEYLDKCIKGIESAWEWEGFGSIRAGRFKEKEYALLDNQPEIFEIPLGGVIRRGLWHTEAKALAEKYNVEIDFSKRGFMNENDPYRRKNAYHVGKNFPRDIFKRIFWREFCERIRAEFRKIRLKI